MGKVVIRKTVAIVGVHGVGKTATAAVLEGLGYRYIRVEAIEVAQALSPVYRQILFFSKYVADFIKAISVPSNKPIVFDSHPLVVIPYTEYWLSKAGIGEQEINEVVNSFIEIVKRLPKVSLLVALKPESVTTVVERIKLRSRFNAHEELNEEYIRYVNEGILRLTDEIGPEIAEKVAYVRAEDEMEYRGKVINDLLIATDSYA